MRPDCSMTWATRQTSQTVVATELAEEGGEPRVHPGCTVAHVLNGAWRWRLDHFNEDSVAKLDRVSMTAIALCEQVRARLGG